MTHSGSRCKSKRHARIEASSFFLSLGSFPHAGENRGVNQRETTRRKTLTFC